MTSPQSTQVLLLKEKLETVKKQQKDLIKTKEIVDTCLVKAEKLVDDFATSKTKSASASIKVALYLDSLEEKLNTCQNVLKSLDDVDTDSPDGILPVDRNELNLTAFTHESQNTVVSILKTQMEELQLQVLNLQERNKTEVIDKIQCLETEMFLMKENNQSDFSNLNSRLQNVEVKQLLIDEMQVKNSEIIDKNNLEMSKLKIDIAAIQDQFSRANVQQEGLQTQIEKIKEATDGLIKLRDILNQKTTNVASRAELAENVAHLQEEIQNIQYEISSLENNAVSSQDNEYDNSNVMPAFTANVSSSYVVLPGKKITFSELSLNKWGCFFQNDDFFEAPVPGIYYFFVSVNADSQGALCIAIIHNNIPKALCSTGGTKDSQTSTSVLLELATGDKVWIEADKQTDMRGIRIGSGYSNFVGFRVK